MKQLFYKRMQEYFKDEYKAFETSLNQEAIKTVFINKLLGKNIVDDILIKLKKVDIHPLMYHYQHDNIGKTYEYQLGLVYPQELSAGIAPLVLNPKKDSVVLDMCSAPGGKAIQLYNMLDQQGLLIANEYDYQRSLIELSNFERSGFSNFILTSNHSKEVAKELESMVDYVLVDAPCSGEGMVRKMPEIIETYSDDNIKSCIIRQEEILENSYRCLKSGGYLVYSTCTFNIYENELMVKEFLTRHDDLELLDIDINHQRRGIVDDFENNKVLRFCFLDGTEGQFISLIHKKGQSQHKTFNYLKTVRNSIVEKFISDHLILDDYYLYQKNDRFYLSLVPLPKINLNIVRAGIFIGTLKQKNFIPEHHLYRAHILKDRFKHVYNLNDKQYQIYLSGNEIEIPSELKGYYLVTYKHYQLGFGKAVDGRLKNKYPKGLRIVV
ncbi:MAG: hypothetical protein SPI53_02810 [Erysipelotrichaceae bacterium]|nr:hypothetical protein [Erysipelotrichaceae bacterium]